MLEAGWLLSSGSLSVDEEQGVPRRFLYGKRSVMVTATGVHNKVSCRTEG